MTEWNVARKIQASKHSGLVLGLAIAAMVCLIVAAVIIKIHWLKKVFSCHCDMDFLEDDFMEDDCCDEHGCRLANEKDFV